MLAATVTSRGFYRFPIARIVEGMGGVFRLFGRRPVRARLVARPASPPPRRQNDRDVLWEVLQFLRRDGGALTTDELLERFREERGRPFRRESLEYIMRRHPKMAFDGKRWCLADEH